MCAKFKLSEPGNPLLAKRLIACVLCGISYKNQQLKWSKWKKKKSIPSTKDLYIKLFITVLEFFSAKKMQEQKAWLL